MQTWGLTDPGLVREQNQDAFMLHQLSENTCLAVVCDGMGGARSGNVASSLALEVFSQHVLENVKEVMTGEEIDALLQEGALLANEKVFEKSRSAEEFEGMGTTLVAVFVEEKCAHIINIGDSRAYYIGKRGIQLVTRDHSFVQMMVQRGDITPEEARQHPGKHLITRAVGTEELVEADLYHVELEPDDCIALCSDGLSNMLADQEILFEIAHGETRDDCCQRLLEIAKHRGAPDNVTVALIACSDAEESK